jgi:hypothetical protein
MLAVQTPRIDRQSAPTQADEGKKQQAPSSMLLYLLG